METIITDDLVKFLTQEMDGKRESVTPNPTDEEAGMIAEAEWAIYTTKQLIADNQALRKRAEEAEQKAQSRHDDIADLKALADTLQAACVLKDKLATELIEQRDAAQGSGLLVTALRQ